MTAWTADAMTGLRLGLAAALVPLLAGGRLRAGGLVLGLAWITDFLDGRLARAADRPTRLGAWDLPVDTAVGAAVLLGLALGGLFPLGLAVGVIVVFGVLFLVTGNYAASAIVQAFGYGALLVRLWTEHVSVRWWPVLVAAAIGVLERRKLLHETLPGFFSGVAELARLPTRRSRRA